MSVAVSLEFETRVLNALDFCLGKMSDSLERKFDPKDKSSMSLFRQFCMTIRVRLQWTKTFFAHLLPPVSKNNSNKKIETKPTGISPMEQPVSWDLIDEVVKKYPITNHSLPLDSQKNGLVMKL